MITPTNQLMTIDNTANDDDGDRYNVEISSTSSDIDSPRIVQEKRDEVIEIKKTIV